MQIIEEELHAQTLVLESLNMNLCNTQMELQKEVGPGWSGAGTEGTTAEGHTSFRKQPWDT